MKGGKVLGSGTYGCIFRPPLLCKGQTERQQGYVSKLMFEEEAEEEYQEVQKLLPHIVSIPNYQNYFIIDGITKCVPQDITTADLEDFNDKCKALTKKGITAALVKNEIRRGQVSALQIPDGGMSVYDYLKRPGLTDQDIINLNDALINLIQYGIRPMNMNGVIHADVKADNIVYSSETKEAKLIDWGLAKVVIPPRPKSGTLFRRKPKPYVPSVNLPIMVNEPLTNILFYEPNQIQFKYNKFLTNDKYKHIIESILRKPTESERQDVGIKSISSFLFHEIFGSSNQMKRVFGNHILGHYSYIADVYFGGDTLRLRETISELIASALFKYSYNPSKNRLKEFDTGKYFQEVFRMNVDIYGTLYCLVSIAGSRQTNRRFVKAAEELENKYMFGRKYAMEPYNIDEISADLRHLNSFLTSAPVGDTQPVHLANPVVPAPVAPAPVAPLGDTPNPVAAPVAAVVAQKLENVRSTMLGGKRTKKKHYRIRVKKLRSKRKRATKRKGKKSKSKSKHSTRRK